MITNTVHWGNHIMRSIWMPAKQRRQIFLTLTVFCNSVQ